ncbi:hypothetical protein [Massilia rhizosphaerae]|uniref:hypothetical protein n=1 Tax=Massilia rhizosphaerae TaxID=2784389 RepID=UPI0018DD2E66|nr:hypothetical protein [Massilia rhizosphaerae]
MAKLRFKQKIRAHGMVRSIWNLYRRLRPSPAPQPRPKAAQIGDLVIVYRHVFISQDIARFPSKARPDGFDYVKCFRRLVETVEASNHASRVRILVLYNGTAEQLEIDPFATYLRQCDRDIEVQLHSARSAVEAALVMMRVVRDLPLEPCDIVYLLENDYLHADGWVDEVFKLYSSGLNFDYVSLYDHPDRYKYPAHYGQSTLYATESRHWTTAPSTCGTFMMKHEVFRRDFEHLYTTKPDHLMFDRLIAGMGRKLLTPVPGLSLHCMSEYLDPVQSLEQYFCDVGRASEA